MVRMRMTIWDKEGDGDVGGGELGVENGDQDWNAD